MKLVKESIDEVPANQMSLISDTEEIVKFLEFAGQKSILNEHTVNCRLTACNNLFSILNEGEDNVEYMIQNLELLINRFRNKHSNVQASTLKVYKSRLKSSLEDYVSWSKDPVAWEKSVMDKSNLARSKERQKGKQAKDQHQDREPVAEKKSVAESAQSSTSSAPAKESRRNSSHERTTETTGSRRISFPVRNDFNLEIVIPNDGLTFRELLKLGLFLYPYCKDSDANAEALPWSLIPRVAN